MRAIKLFSHDQHIKLTEFLLVQLKMPSIGTYKHFKKWLWRNW